jgi:hypothetical protein
VKPAQQVRLVIVSATAGVLGPILFGIVTIVLGYQWAGYNLLTSTISELGATNAPTMWLQALNFAILGILTMVFAVGLTVQNGRFRSTSLLFGIYGFGTLVVAGLPCDPGCSFKGTSPVRTAHSLDALISFVVLAIAPLFFWRSSHILPSWTKISVVSLGIGIGSSLLLFTYLAITVLSLSPYVGLIQRIFLGLLFAWMITLAYKIARLSLNHS